MVNLILIPRHEERSRRGFCVFWEVDRAGCCYWGPCDRDDFSLEVDDRVETVFFLEDMVDSFTAVEGDRFALVVVGDEDVEAVDAVVGFGHGGGGVEEGKGVVV